MTTAKNLKILEEIIFLDKIFITMPTKFLHKMFAALIIDWESYKDLKRE